MTIELELENSIGTTSGLAGFWRKIRWDALLVFLTVIWGSTFLLVQNSIKLVEPFSFLSMRFTIATLALAIIFRKRIVRITRRELVTGSIIGVFVFSAFALQTVGLQFTTASKAGFITGLYVPLVPVMAIFLLRHFPAPLIWVGVFFSTLGMGLLSINDNFNLDFGMGELLVLGCAVACALHIVTVSKFAPQADAINLTTVQIGVTALLSLASVLISGEPWVIAPAPAWGSALFMGLIATAFALSVMNRAQQFISSTRATLIYALEPAWAGLFGVLAGETLSLPAMLGCLLIFAGMVVSGIGESSK